MMMRLFTRRLSLVAAGVIAVAVAGVATGCGSGDSNDSSTASTADFTGPPVTIFTSTPIGTPLADTPEIGAAVKAAARNINENGGLRGHEVKVEVCNDTDPNAEVACARKAADTKALAFSGAVFLFNPAAAEQDLAKEKIPNTANVALQPVEYSQSINFPIDMPIFGLFPCVTQAPAASGKTHVATITQNTPEQVEGAKQLQTVAQGSGAQYSGSVSVPATQTDLSSQARQLADDGAEVVVNFLFPAQLPALVQAATSLGEQFVYCGAGGNSPVDVLKQLGASAGDYYVGQGLPPTSEASKYPLLQQFVDQMAAEENAGDADASLSKGLPYHALRAWLGMQVIKQVAGSVKGDLTSQSLLAAMNKATVHLDGVTPPLDFAKDVPVPGFERAFNPTLILTKWDPGKQELVATGQAPQNGLELLAAGGQ